MAMARTSVLLNPTRTGTGLLPGLTSVRMSLPPPLGTRSPVYGRYYSTSSNQPSHLPPPPTDTTTSSSSSSRLKRLLALVGLGGLAGFAAYCSSHSQDRPKQTGTLGSLLLPSPHASLAHCSGSGRFNFIAEAVEKAAPSVVHIEISRQVELFFGIDAMAVAAGSGFVVEDGSYVLTNAHVVSNAQSVDVKLNTGQVVRGEVTDIDEIADLALIKMDLPPGVPRPPALRFGDSDGVRPGEWVVAMGSPLTLSNTITCGIVSALHRPGKELGITNQDMHYVQTDAAITMGNSGGPLVNLDGDVIGVNTMTAGPGISFAIPSTVARSFVRSASKRVTGKFSNKKYTIGVSMLTLSPRMMSSIRQYFSIPQDVSGGVLLTKVWANSPAHAAGLKRGDVVVRVNGRKIGSSNDLYEMVRSGEKLSVEFYRKLRYMKCIVVPEGMN